jgi:hypothetical protein
VVAIAEVDVRKSTKLMGSMRKSYSRDIPTLNAVMNASGDAIPELRQSVTPTRAARQRETDGN